MTTGTLLLAVDENSPGYRAGEMLGRLVFVLPAVGLLAAATVLTVIAMRRRRRPAPVPGQVAEPVLVADPALASGAPPLLHPPERTTGLWVAAAVCAVVGTLFVLLSVLGYLGSRLPDRRTLTAPSAAGDLEMVRDARVEKGTERLRSELGPDFMAVPYAKQGEFEPYVLFVGSPMRLADPRAGLRNWMAGFAAKAGVLGGARDYDPGPLGGVLRCARVGSSGTDRAICAWADQWTIGMVSAMDPSVEQSELATVLVRMRSDMEHKAAD